jgi:hypothetical protein
MHNCRYSVAEPTVIHITPLRGIVKKFVLAINLKGGYRVLACLTRSFFDAIEE